MPSQVKGDPADFFWRNEGRSVILACRGLTVREIWQLVAYLKSRVE